MSTAKKAPAGNRSRPARGNAIPGCALTAALAAIGGRWKLFVVYRLADGPRHFAALRRSLPDVSAKVLAEQLRELQAHQAACATAPLDVGVDARAICGVTSPSPHASPAPSFRAQ
ncbi:MAG: helix-turn-helix transcriptional regulator [Burkholderiales bacterium]|nr:helix-turn-helix transcriptional regulator [Burkholderiales bacterium]